MSAQTSSSFEMSRTLLEKMLASAPGAKRAESGFTIDEEHRASLYIGGASQTTSISDVIRLALHDLFVEIEVKDRTRHFVPYPAVLGLSVRPPRDDGPRTGF